MGAGGSPPCFRIFGRVPVREMARYEHLPIYKKDLTIYLEKIVRNFSRYHKYTWVK